MFTGVAVGVVTRPAVKLTEGCPVYAIGVTNYTGVLWPVLILLIV